MNRVPSLSYSKIIRALQRDGWTVIRQRGSHIRLQKRSGDEVLNWNYSDNHIVSGQPVASKCLNMYHNRVSEPWTNR